MNNFNPEYIKLLRRQVEEEIGYLQCKGHNQDLIDDPCIFCYEARTTPGESRTNGYYANKYKCNRMKELKSFVSRLADMENSSGYRSLVGSCSRPSNSYNANSMRVPIGFPVSSVEEDLTYLAGRVNESSKILPSGLLPPMSINLKL